MILRGVNLDGVLVSVPLTFANSQRRLHGDFLALPAWPVCLFCLGEIKANSHNCPGNFGFGLPHGAFFAGPLAAAEAFESSFSLMILFVVSLSGQLFGLDFGACVAKLVPIFSPIPRNVFRSPSSPGREFRIIDNLSSNVHFPGPLLLW